VKPGDVMLIYLNNQAPPERDVTYDYKWDNRRHKSQRCAMRIDISSSRASPSVS
jgi:hypothetical protein